MYRHVSNLKSQQGVATLFVVIVLLILITIISLTVARKGLVEQQSTGNDIRSREVQEAAEAGLEMGIAFAASNSIPWPAGGNPNDRDTWTCPGDVSCPNLGQIDATTSGEAYQITSLRFIRTIPTSEFIQIISRAGTVVGGEESISAVASVFIKPGGLLSSEGKLPPPLVMDGCMTSTTGTPDIYPTWKDIDGDGEKTANEWEDLNGNGEVDPGEWDDGNENGTVDNELGPGIMTSQPEYVGGEYCANYCGKGGGSCPDAATGKPHLDLHGGPVGNNKQFPDRDGDGEGTIWEYYFDVTPEQYQDVASDSLSTDSGFYYITDSGNWSNGTYGSPSSPAVIVFENGCPKPQGNTTVYGIVLFIEENGCVSDPMNGWGNVTIHGSIGANGGIHKMNANLEIYGVGNDDGSTVFNDIPIDASKLPGTWNDFIAN